ncbi:enoyl-CoA hydratase-related protein [Thermocrispum sp.]|jgi:enoyl-CoA hydratase/carnithine racemase|uniref:Enoyl-CoA hydratase n=1 Tax=Thermocrispum agreste TaxID=37925 RepID=A0A2W4JN03_9PSEU|nr:enoyl-CoA hydratase-related protein [Thermocrispum sp.]PZM99851.1 MAG: enoyl-CoA hydratase [Thermocrispum agreste]
MSATEAKAVDAEPGAAVSFGMRGKVLWVHLQRPEVLNAINPDMVDGLHRAVDRAEQSDVRAVVVRGTGRAFCAGADLVEVPGEEPDVGRIEAIVDRVAAVVNRIAALPKPVIAGVNGIAAAGGLELVLACDIVIASEQARFADAHSNYGLLPGAGGAARLPRAVGPNLAKRLMFTGEFVSAEELVPTGFVTRVVAADELDRVLTEVSESLAARSPRVLAAMKRMVDAAGDVTLKDGLAAEADTLRDYLRTRDVLIGLAAFRDGTRPVFED